MHVSAAGIAAPDMEEIQRLYGRPVEPSALLQGKVRCTRGINFIADTPNL